MAQIWDPEILGEQPHMCAGCSGSGDCATQHDPFFNVLVDGVLYGLFNCECLCDPANVEALVHPPD